MDTRCARRPSPFRLSFVLLFACQAACQLTHASEWQQSESPITSADAAKRLPASDADRKLPITLHGVVTCVPEGWKGFFMEDASGGVYCEPQNTEAEQSFWPVRVGEDIELRGVSAPGHRNSFVAVASIVSRKSGRFPQPPLRTIRSTIDDRIDADFVKVRGHIVGLVNIAGEMEYGLLADGVEAEVVHSGFRIDPKVFEHAEVEICGTVIPQEANVRPIKIIVPDATSFKMLATHLEVIESTNLSSIQEVLQPPEASSPVVKISASIFCNDADETWLVDNGHGIAWSPNGTLLPDGTKHVELLGILKRDGGRRWIKYGTVLSTSKEVNAQDFSPTMSVAQIAEHVNQIVSVNATFWDANVIDSKVILSFDIGNAKLSCRVLDDSASGGWTDLQRGAVYRVTGLLTPASATNVSASALVIRSLKDVAMVTGPPWPIQFTLYIVSLLSGGLAIGLATTVYCWKQASSARLRLEAARNDLRQANETLEARVAERTLELDTINRKLTDEATARLLVENNQKQTLASLEDAQSLAQMGSFVWNSSTSNSAWSKQCFIVHGLDCEESPPTLDEYCTQVDAEDRTAFKNYLLKATRSSDREEFRYRITLPNGDTRWVRSLIKSVQSTDGSLISIEGIVQNVTEQVTAEEQLRHSVKMEVAGHLAGGIAHDLNNTLAIIKLNCFLLNSVLAKRDPIPDFNARVEAIEAAAEKSAMLTRQLLTFSRKQIIRPIVLNVNKTIRSFSPLVSQLLEDRITIEFNLAEKIAEVRLDQGQLEQLLMNLILNARDAINASGTIQICTSDVTVTSDEKLARWVLQPKCGKYVSLSVNDTGSGIAPESVHKIFEPFFSTKGDEKGTGLGLAVVHGIVRQNNGGLSVESHPNQGTTFTLLIPVANESEGGSMSDPLQGDSLQVSQIVSASAVNKESILLVDDEPAVCKHTEHVLKHLGYEVTTSNSAEDALALCRSHSTNFQLLITDYSMPGMSGLELAKKIREHVPDLPVILMSGFLNEEAFRSTPAGLEPIFIQKPFAIQDLATSIRKAINQLEIVENLNGRAGSSMDSNSVPEARAANSL